MCFRVVYNNRFQCVHISFSFLKDLNESYNLNLIEIYSNICTDQMNSEIGKDINDNKENVDQNRMKH